jgi:hypothetical protein
MLRPKRVKNGKAVASRLSSVGVVAWLISSWSSPAFPDEKPHLQLAPIRIASTISGNVGYTFQRNKSGSSDSTQQVLGVGVDLGVRAASYLWQPWFARVTGSVGVGLSTNTASSNRSATTNSAGMVLTGDAALNLLQYSRFPFEAQVYRTDSQTSGSLNGLNSGYVKSGLALTQNYRSLNGKTNGLASYIQSRSGRASFGTEDVMNQLNFNLTTEPAYSHQTFRVTGAMTKMDRPLRGDKSLTDILMTNHLYRPDPALSVSSFINLIKTSHATTSSMSPPQQNDYNSQQLSSFASWRPEGSPLTLTSSARLLRLNSSMTGVAAPGFEATNLTLGANYAWSSLLRMYGSVNVNDNSGIQTVSTDAALSAQKGFGERESTNIGGFRYTRYVGASLGNQTTTTSNSNRTTTSSIQRLGLSAGHDLSKSTALGSGRLTTDLNQGLSTTVSTKGSPFTHLNTAGSLVWNEAEGNETTMVSLHAADSRTLSAPQNFSQLINLQASRNERLARNQSLTGNLTMQASRSGASNVPTTPFAGAPSANLSYHHLRLFEVKNLTFDSTLQILGAIIIFSQGSANQQGGTTQSQAKVSWDNNLDYFIGRLKLRLYTHIAEVNKVTQSSLIFTMNRSF